MITDVTDWKPVTSKDKVTDTWVSNRGKILD